MRTATKVAAPEVLQLEAERLNAVELEKVKPLPDFVVAAGKSENWEKVLHRGELIVMLYAAKPVLLKALVPFPYDEFVWVLDGELTLTHVDGQPATYTAGDAVFVPKGFMGSWETRGNYRELAIIEAAAMALSRGNRD